MSPSSPLPPAPSLPFSSSGGGQALSPAARQTSNSTAAVHYDARIRDTLQFLPSTYLLSSLAPLSFLLVLDYIMQMRSLSSFPPSSAIILRCCRRYSVLLLRLRKQLSDMQLKLAALCSMAAGRRGHLVTRVPH